MSTREPSIRIGRRKFTEQGLLLLLSGVTITVAACGSDSNPPGPTTQGDVSGSISANHGHVATLLAAQITAGGAVLSLNIQGGATHAHFIDVSAAQIGTIAARGQVTVTSTTDQQHNHTVTFN
jgi:hypothetical protein